MFTDEQSYAIKHYKGPMLVLGTPGSGKTTVITNRINTLINDYGVNQGQILVITFTKAAAVSMRKRFLELTHQETTKVRFGTFHSFFYWIIRTAYGNMGVLDESTKRNVIRDILREIDQESYDNDETLSSVINQLGVMSSDMIEIGNYYSRDMSEQDFEKLYQTYKSYKEERGLLDFDDMVTECYRLLVNRPDILERVRCLYPFIMVDEYQDTNRIQYEILKMLAHPRDNLYVVGDDDQSVYGFRGARPDIIFKFEQEFSGAEVVHLSSNFRCPKEIVELSSKVISGNKKRYAKQLLSASPYEGVITFDRPKDSRHQAEMIALRLRDMDKEMLDNTAVLYRTNIQPRLLIYKLREYSIPFTVRDVLPDIFSHPYIKPIIDYISYSLGDHSRKVFLNIMNKPVRYISRDMLKKEQVELIDLVRAAKDKDYLVKSLRDMNMDIKNISRLTPYAAVNYIRQAVGYDRYLRTVSAEKNMDIDELITVVDEFQSLVRDCDDFGKMYDMIQDSQELSKNTENRSGDGVQLMTLHSAKGLEFNTVHIIDLNEGMMPHKKAKTEVELEEERRLLYVGITRSREVLHLYIPQKNGEDTLKVSRFLKGITDKE